MSVLVDLGGVCVNPDNVVIVESVVSEHQVVRDGVSAGVEKTYEVHIRCLGGIAQVLEAKTQDEAAQQQLRDWVVNQINIGLNTTIAVVGN